MLGYSAVKAEVVAAETGATYKRHAAGSRTRTRQPQIPS